jgi:hypothetical protein
MFASVKPPGLSKSHLAPNFDIDHKRPAFRTCRSLIFYTFLMSTRERYPLSCPSARSISVHTSLLHQITDAVDDPAGVKIFQAAKYLAYVQLDKFLGELAICKERVPNRNTWYIFQEAFRRRSGKPRYTEKITPHTGLNSLASPRIEGIVQCWDDSNPLGYYIPVELPAQRSLSPRCILT